jgi:hypothetical protein
MGFGLVIGFIELSQIVTISNYSALANSHTRFLTTAHTKSSRFVLTGRCSETDPNKVLFCSRRCRHSTISQLTHCSNCGLSTKSQSQSYFTAGGLAMSRLFDDVSACLLCHCIGTSLVKLFGYVTIIYDSHSIVI